MPPRIPYQSDNCLKYVRQKTLDICLSWLAQRAVAAHIGDKELAIGFRAEPAVQDSENAAIRRGADQAAESLLQAQDGARHLVMCKRISALALNVGGASGDERIGGNLEWQLVDDHRA